MIEEEAWRIPRTVSSNLDASIRHKNLLIVPDVDKLQKEDAA